MANTIRLFWTSVAVLLTFILESTYMYLAHRYTVAIVSSMVIILALVLCIVLLRRMMKDARR